MKYTEPAFKSYFFGRGYVDLGRTIKYAFKNVLKFTLFFFSKIRDFWIRRPDNKFLFVLWLIPLAIVAIFWLFAAISVLIFGTVTTIAVSILHIVVVAIIMVVVYILFTLVWAIDRVYLIIKRISSVCPACHEKFLIPTYRCTCGRLHNHLMPGKYGILHRRCECGKKLGTTFLTKRGKGIEAICPKCGTVLSGLSGGTGKVPICVPVIGGRSSGKSAYITAFTHMFRENLAPLMNWKIEEYDIESKDDYRVLSNNYETGMIQQTDEYRKVQRQNVSSVPIRFSVSGRYFRPAREIHIYDVAGEAFTSDNLAEIQKQYEHCHGIVMILDPFSIKNVFIKYEEELIKDNNTYATISSADLLEVSYSLFNYLEKVTGIDENKISDIPLALVIGKIDAAGISEELGRNAVVKLVTEKGDFSRGADVEDYICRKFLIKYGMGNFVTMINNKFKNNRYFACSAMGHTMGAGEYKPIGVMRPMEWIFRQADLQMNAQWKETRFTHRPFAIKMENNEILRGR